MKEYSPKEYWGARLNSFNLEAVGFDSFGTSYNRWMYRMARVMIERIIKSGKVNPGGKKILDIGCGTGFYVDIWKKYGIEDLAGIDIASVGISKLIDKYPEYNFYEADISSIDRDMFNKDGYDIVTAFAVLFHIVDDNKFEEAISNIRSLCADNGLIVITDIFPHKRPYILRHQKSRVLSDYESILERNGIEVIDRIPFYVLLNAPLDISSMVLQKIALGLWVLFGGIEKITHLMGGVLYAFDLFLTKILKESPSTEMIICKRREI